MTGQNPASRYLEAVELLPPCLREPAHQLDEVWQSEAEELRLRVGRPMTVVCSDRERAVPGAAVVTSVDLERVLEIATRASIHTAQAQISNGFLTVAGGHRIGICGSGVLQDGQVRNLRHISSMDIRIAREVFGSARPVLDKLLQGELLQSTLLVSPPGGGKTTLLRDLIRCISDGVGCPALRVGVADERGELAAMRDGVAQFDVGGRTDVMDGCPKEKGLLMLLRGMNPQVLAADEITAPEDCRALEVAANCGVVLLCSAHGLDLEDLKARPLYRELLERGIFHRLVVIHRKNGTREYQVVELC